MEQMYTGTIRGEGLAGTKGGSATPRFRVRGGRGWAHSVARPWVPISTYGLSLAVFRRNANAFRTIGMG